MGINEPNSLAYQDALRQLARELEAARHGTKGPLKRGFCTRWDISPQTLHKHLKNVGWYSGRKLRKDAGASSVDDHILSEISAALRLGVHKNGKATMQTPTARSVLASNGREIRVGNAQVNRLLKRKGMDLATQRQGSAHIHMRSTHPNQVHQVDPSLCLLYYTLNGKQCQISDAEVYKNKPEAIEKLKALKLWRYVLTDHYSGIILVRYYQSHGETQENLYDFLLWCWAWQDGRPFHGVPDLLVWDKGSANTAAGIKNALRALTVGTYEHEAGNPKCKGQVENGNNLVETQFESRLKYEPVSSVDELNAAAERWCIAWNANLVPHQDSRLHRRGMARPTARFDLWQTIRQDQLRILPPDEVCRYLFKADPETRIVRADRSIGFRHPVSKRSETYDLRHIPEVYPRLEVLASPLIYGPHQVVVTVEDYRGEKVEHIVSPVDYDSVSGQRRDSPVWGERFEALPDSVADTAGKAADHAAFPGLDQAELDKAKKNNAAPFGGLDAHSHLADVYLPEYMERRGTELHLPDRARVECKPLSNIEARRALVGDLGRNLTGEEAQWIRDAYPEGVPETEMPALAGRLRAGDTPAQPSRPGLAVVK